MSTTTYLTIDALPKRVHEQYATNLQNNTQILSEPFHPALAETQSLSPLQQPSLSLLLDIRSPSSWAHFSPPASGSSRPLLPRVAQERTCQSSDHPATKREEKSIHNLCRSLKEIQAQLTFITSKIAGMQKG